MNLIEYIKSLLTGNKAQNIVCKKDKKEVAAKVNKKGFSEYTMEVMLNNNIAGFKTGTKNASGLDEMVQIPFKQTKSV